ncbi:MAG: peptidoglycan DL-endopeptidase CwlO [Subtercola sp.]|nr:peptidoglycan DL-endopeptidase CwlO [Subtercola sp.]
MPLSSELQDSPESKQNPKSLTRPRVSHAQPRKKLKVTKRGIASTVVMTAAAGLIATMALPAYAFSTAGAFDPSTSTTSIETGQQTLAVDAAAVDSAVSRDTYVAPSKGDLAAAKTKVEAEAAAAAAKAAALQVATVASTSVTSKASTTSSSGLVVNPPSGPYSGEAVVAFAQQFVGVVPYGAGASPDTSFGCDGLTQYVFGQFGIKLPRTVSNQAAMGTRISAADAQAGDLMIYPIGHVGIYAGDGTMIDSPDWGRYVEHRPVWGSYYFVRLGI